MRQKGILWGLGIACLLLLGLFSSAKVMAANETVTEVNPSEVHGEIKKDIVDYQPEPFKGRKTILFGHSEAVNSIAFSPDGKTVVTGSSDETIKVWEVESGKLLRKITGHSDPIYSVTISPDGAIIASGSGGGSDYSARLWNKNSGHLLHTFDLGGIVYSVAFSRDGKLLASADWDVISIHDIESTKKTIQFPWYSKHTAVNSVAFSFDGKMLLSAHDEGFIKMWDVTNGNLIGTLSGHSGRVTSLAVGVNNLLVSGSDDTKVIIWDIPNKKLVHTLKGHNGRVTSVDIQPSSHTLVSGDDQGVIIFWDATEGKMLQSYSSKIGRVTSIAFSPDGNNLAVASANGAAEIWYDVGTYR